MDRSAWWTLWHETFWCMNTLGRGTLWRDGHFGVEHFGVEHFGMGYFGVGHFGVGHFGVGHFGVRDTLVQVILGWETLQWGHFGMALQDFNCRLFISCGALGKMSHSKLSHT